MANKYQHHSREKHETLAEQARRQGVTVATLKRQLNAKRDEEAARRALWVLAEKSAGWNPRAGNKKRVTCTSNLKENQ